jgi:hypothetical protein
MNSLENLNAQLKAIHEQRAQIFEKIKPLQEQASVLYSQIIELNDAITVETLKTEQSEQDRFDFLMAESGSGSDMIRYRAADTLIRSMGLYMSGHCPFSQQRSADVFIFKADEDRNTQSIASIKKLIELFKPMDDDGNKLFRVFCEDYTIFCHSDGKFSLRGCYNKNQEFETLEALFTYYVATYHCYDSDDNDNSDD